MLVKMLHREPRIALLIQPQHAQDLRGRCPSARRLADPPIAQALRPLIAQPVAPPPERPLRYPQHLRRFSLRQLAPLMPLEQPLETHLPYPLQHLRPDHPPPPFWAVLKPDRSRATKTGQITSQLHVITAALPLSVPSSSLMPRAFAAAIALTL